MAPATQPSKSDSKPTDPKATASTDQEAAGQGPADPSTASGEGAETKPKQQKTPVPEGHVTPVEFAKKVDEHLGLEAGTTRPQSVYGMIKNSKKFAEIAVEREGMPKWTIPLEAGLAFIDEKEKGKVERAKAKAAKEAAAAEEAKGADAAPKTTPNTPAAS
jgi:hypothetical protein